MVFHLCPQALMRGGAGGGQIKISYIIRGKRKIFKGKI